MTAAREPVIALLEDYAILKCQKIPPPKKKTPQQTKQKKPQTTKLYSLAKRLHTLLQKQDTNQTPVTVKMTFWLEGYLMHLVYLLRY